MVCEYWLSEYDIETNGFDGSTHRANTEKSPQKPEADIKLYLQSAHINMVIMRKTHLGLTMDDWKLISMTPKPDLFLVTHPCEGMYRVLFNK